MIWVLGRHQAVSSVASSVDFATMGFLVEALHASPAFATALGATLGGIVSFLLNRVWVFPGRLGGVALQGVRYAAVCAGSIALNTAGEALAVRALGAPYIPSRLVVAAAVGVAYNFPLHRSFVFRNGATS